MILALQTADHTSRFWLFDDPLAAAPIAHLEWESGRKLSDELLARILNMLKDQDSRPKDLHGIVIYSGPGSFTSLRIGHAVANALADSLEIPILGTRGDEWIKLGLKKLTVQPVSQIALPYYGSEAHITKPRT